MADLKQFKQNNKIGYKDRNDEIVINAIYDDGPMFLGSQSIYETPFACVAKSMSCGIIDEYGNEIIPFEYEEIYYLFDNLFAARRKEKKGQWSFGVIDSEGNVLIPFKYKYIDKIGKYIKCCNKANSKRKYSFQLMDTEGRIFEYNALNESEWYNSNCKIIYQGKGVKSEYGYLITRDDNGLGAINSDGLIIVPSKYEEIHCVRKDRFVARLKTEESWRFGVIDNNGKIIIPFEYKFISHESNAFYECYKECRCEYNCNNWNSHALTPEYLDKKDVTWYNEKGEFVCSLKSKIISNNLLGVQSNEKWGVINQSNSRIVNFIYDDVDCIQNYIIVSKDKNVGILDDKGRLIINPSYESIECIVVEDKNYGGFSSPISYGRYSKEYVFDSSNNNSKIYSKKIVHNSGYYGYGRSNGIEITGKDKFDFNRYFILTTNQYSELFSVEKGLLPNSRFETIRQLSNISFAVKENNKWGVFRADTSNLIIECEYDRIRYEGHHVVLLQKDGLWGAKTLVNETYPNFTLFYDVDVPVNFKEIEILEPSELIFGVKRERERYNGEKVEEYSIINNKGQVLGQMSEFYYLDRQCAIFNSNYDRILASKKNKFGFISVRGYVAIPFQYDEVTYREDGYFDVCKNENWGVIDMSGREIVSIKYSEKIPQEWNNTIVKNAHTGRLGILAEDGSEKVPSIYEHLKIGNNFIFYGFKGYEIKGGDFFSNIQSAIWGVMNMDGKVIIEPKYDCYIEQYGLLLAGRDGRMLYHHDSDYGSDYSGVYDLYSSTGELIFGGFSEFQYNESNELYIFFLGGKWSIYSECVDEWNNITIHDYTFIRGIGLWLFLDKNLKSIIRYENGKQAAIKRGAICNIEVKKQENRNIYVYNLPISIMARGFCGINNNVLLIGDSNDSNRNIAAIDIKTGKRTPFYSDLIVVSESLFYFSENGKIGIRNFEDVIKQAKYTFLTLPQEGFFFAAEELDEKQSRLLLFSIFDENVHEIAIEKIDTKDLIEETAYGRLLISFDDTSHNIKDIILPKLDLFDDSFKQLVSGEQSDYFCSKYKNIYWLSCDSRLHDNNFHEDDGDDRDFDESDYAEDTWYALTDGMYGDYPGGDVDYEIFGF